MSILSRLAVISFWCSEACRESCVGDDTCTMYQFDVANKMCRTCQAGLIERVPFQDGHNKTAGWCPKVMAELTKYTTIGEKTQYWCRKNSWDELCSFPFQLEEDDDDTLRYTPVDEPGVKKCIMTKYIHKNLTKFPRYNLEECEECRFTDYRNGINLISEF